MRAIAILGLLVALAPVAGAQPAECPAGLPSFTSGLASLRCTQTASGDQTVHTMVLVVHARADAPWGEAGGTLRIEHWETQGPYASSRCRVVWESAGSGPSIVWGDGCVRLHGDPGPSVPPLP